MEIGKRIKGKTLLRKTLLLQKQAELRYHTLRNFYSIYNEI